MPEVMNDRSGIVPCNLSHEFAARRYRTNLRRRFIARIRGENLSHESAAGNTRLHRQEPPARVGSATVCRCAASAIDRSWSLEVRWVARLRADGNASAELSSDMCPPQVDRGRHSGLGWTADRACDAWSHSVPSTSFVSFYPPPILLDGPLAGATGVGRTGARRGRVHLSSGT